MSNVRNEGTVIGRLTRDITVFTNSDGSHKVLFTVAAQDNFKSGVDKTRKTQFVPLEAFVSKYSNGLGVYGYMHKGDLVAVNYTVKSSSYQDRSGQTRYTIALSVTSVELMESKAAAEERRVRTAGSAATQVPAWMTDFLNQPGA